MKHGTPRIMRRRRAGAAYIEALIAGLILSIGILGLVELWSFSFQTSVRTDNTSVAYNIGRRAIEEAKRIGFWYVAEGSVVSYVLADQTTVSESSGEYRVTRRTSSSPSWPNNRSVRVVTVTVRDLRAGADVYTTHTILVRAGI